MYGLELEGLSLAEVTELARSLAAQIAVLQAQLVDCARAIEARSGELGGDTPRQFVAFECGLTEDEAHRVCRLADRLEGLPRLADAFREGRLSEGTVSLLLRVATRENESHLLDVAEAATATQLRTIVREYQRVRESEADATDLDNESRPDRLSRGWAPTAATDCPATSARTSARRSTRCSTRRATSCGRTRPANVRPP